MDKRAFIIDNIDRIDIESRRVLVQLLQQVGATSLMTDTNVGVRIDLGKLSNLQINCIYGYMSNKLGHI